MTSSVFSLFAYCSLALSRQIRTLLRLGGFRSSFPWHFFAMLHLWTLLRPWVKVRGAARRGAGNKGNLSWEFIGKRSAQVSAKHTAEAQKGLVWHRMGHCTIGSLRFTEKNKSKQRNYKRKGKMIYSWDFQTKVIFLFHFLLHNLYLISAILIHTEEKNL